MPGTIAGGKKVIQTMIMNKMKQGMTRQEAEEAVQQHYMSIGAKGGRNGNTGGFAANPTLARIAGARGGRKSRRKPAVKIDSSIKPEPVEVGA